MQIHVMGTLSSILKMDGHASAATETIQVSRLDDILPQIVPDPAAKIALKLDVQGFEKDVIDGALKSLDRVHAILIEVSLLLDWYLPDRGITVTNEMRHDFAQLLGRTLDAHVLAAAPHLVAPRIQLVVIAHAGQSRFQRALSKPSITCCAMG